MRYKFKKEWRDGSSAVEMGPMTFISRLAALIPPPRANLVTYHGVLAPAASYRERVVPATQDEPQPQCSESQEADATGSQDEVSQKRRSRMLWAEAMKRGLDLDVLTCEHCGGKREVLKCITDPKVITKILDHLGLATSLPTIAPARAPPGSESLFDL